MAMAMRRESARSLLRAFVHEPGFHEQRVASAGVPLALHTTAAAWQTGAFKQLQGASDHNTMRSAFETSKEMVRLEKPAMAGVMELSAVNQMYQYAGFNFTYYLSGNKVKPELLKKALQGVLAEVPHLAGRGAVLGRGAQLKDVAVDCNNAGVEFATATAPNIRLQDVGPHSWSMIADRTTLDNAPMQFYDTPLNPANAREGKEPPLKIRLTELADGQVLSTSCWHSLADAGRGIKLVARLSEHYRALAAGQPVSGRPLVADQKLLNSVEELTEALGDKLPEGWKCRPTTWESDIKMSLGQRLTLPWKMYRAARGRADVHTLYFPEAVVARVKEAVSKACEGFRISTADAMQAMLFTVMADLRGRPLVPTSPQMFTTTADMLQGLPLSDPHLASQYLGNALEIVFLEGDSERWGAGAHASKEERLLAAMAVNARLIREGVAAYRASPTYVLNTVAGFQAMVRQGKMKVAGDYMKRTVLKKIASSSYLTKFPLHEVDFGAGPPQHLKIDILPWSDWWYSAGPAPGIDNGKGIICRLVLGHGTAGDFVEHPVWSVIAAGTQLARAGTLPPAFGSGAK